MRVLVYGFKQRIDGEESVTQPVLEALKSVANVKTKVFPVKFSQQLFLEEVKKVKPDVILGLGQHPRGKKLRIERKATNEKRDAYDGQVKKIAAKGAKEKRLGLSIPQTKNNWYSYDAGKYIGNYSMYVIANYAGKQKIPFGFVHIPKTYNKTKAVSYVRKLIKGFSTQTSLSNF